MSQQDKTDPRLVSLRMPCSYCKHAIHIGSPYGFSEHSTCSAYPVGIPYSIQMRYRNHDKVNPTQEGSDVYESEEYSFPDGLFTITFEGDWQKKETK